jgi:hypothetical protein
MGGGNALKIFLQRKSSYIHFFLPKESPNCGTGAPLFFGEDSPAKGYNFKIYQIAFKRSCLYGLRMIKNHEWRIPRRDE